MRWDGEGVRDGRDGMMDAEGIWGDRALDENEK